MKRLMFAMLAVAVLLVAVPVLAGCGSSPEEQLPPIDFITPDESSTENSSVPVSVADAELAAGEPDADGVELLGVGIAAEGAYVIVQFKAPPDLAGDWQQGSIYVVDEATSIMYSEIPTVPVLGQLFGRPKEDGQVGYVMLSNAYSGVKSGSVVTVVLGRFKREHVTVV